MEIFKAKTFNIPELKGISRKNLDEHLKLYEGYVKNANLVIEKIAALKQDSEKNLYEIGEVNRRFSFEYNGVRNHELYFAQFEGGAAAPSEGSLKQAIASAWGSFESWMKEFKMIGTTRGIGWAMLYYDRSAKRLLHAWIDEQHLGQLQNCAPILALDMWEHSYVADYQPSGKKTYIEDFFANLNWKAIEQRFEAENR